MKPERKQPATAGSPEAPKSDFVPKFQGSTVKISPLRYWRRSYRNIADLQIQYKGTWAEITEHAARLIQKEKDAWEQGQGKGQGRT